MLKKGASSLTEANETHRSLRCNKKINYEEEEEEGGNNGNQFWCYSLE